MQSRQTNQHSAFFAVLNGRYALALEEIRESHARIWVHPQHPHFTLHGPPHAAAVRDHLEAWLRDYPMAHLSELETFLLLSAIYLHDIGMQCPCKEFLGSVGVNEHVPLSDSGLEAVRQHHHHLSRKMVEDLLASPREYLWGHVDVAGIEPEIAAIAMLCEGHAGQLEDVDPRVTANYTALWRPTNLSKLLYLLRIGDAMDAVANRVNSDYIALHYWNMRVKDRYHTWKHWFVSNVEVVGATVEFNYVIPKALRNLTPDIQTCAEAPLRGGFKDVGEDLARWGLPNPLIRSNVHELLDDPRRRFRLDNDVWTTFNNEAKRIRDRLAEKEPTAIGMDAPYSRLITDDQTSSLLIDEVNRVFVSPRYVIAPSTPDQEATDLSTSCMQILSQKGQSPLVLAPYGMGKSYFLRRLASDMLTKDARKYGKHPVIVPLRDLHHARSDNTDLLDAVLRVVGDDGGKPIDYEGFRRRWKKGELLLLFDALDEIPFIIEKAADRWLGFLLSARPNDIIVTCRAGLLSEQALSDTKVAPRYLTAWHWEDFDEYVGQCKGLIAVPDDVLAIVKENPTLTDFATRPLYARFIVEVAAQGVEYLAKSSNEYKLTGYFVRSAFERKSHLPSFRGKIDAKIKCLSVIAGYLFREKRGWSNVEELESEAKQQLAAHSTKDIRAFFKKEISVYSLMQPCGNNVVEFSHETIRDYFTVKYLVDLWGLPDGARYVAEHLGLQLLSTTAIQFLTQHFQEEKEYLLKFAEQCADDDDANLRDNCCELIASLKRSTP